MHAQGQEVTLAVVLVGQDPHPAFMCAIRKEPVSTSASVLLSYELAEDTSEEEVLALIDKLNGDKDVNGILVQLPLLKHMDEDKITRAIDPLKDVDGFHPQNVGALSIGLPGFVSCTPAGIIQLLKRSHIDMEGKHCVIVGRSNIVGKPMALLMLRENATVTVTHSKTKDLASVTRQADIPIVAIGKRSSLLRQTMSKRESLSLMLVCIGMRTTICCGDVHMMR